MNEEEQRTKTKE